MHNRDLDRMVGDPWTAELPPFCPYCFYVLATPGLDHCSECGARFVRQALLQASHRLRYQLARLGHMNGHVRLGLKFAAGGLAAYGIALLRDQASPSFAEFARLSALLCGFPAMALGFSVLRAKRIPYWAVDYLREQPDYALGLATAALGAALMVASVLF